MRRVNALGAIGFRPGNLQGLKEPAARQPGHAIPRQDPRGV